MGFWSSIGNALTGGLSGMLSSAVQGVSSYLSSKQQYKWQKDLTKQQYGYNLKLQKQAQLWQQKNLSSAHQIEVSDMRKAGLNPILSATGGSGAATGSVGGSSVGLGSAPDIDIDPVTSWATAKNVKNETELRKSQVNLNDAQEWQARKSSSLIGEQARNEAERYDNIIAERDKIRQDIENSKAITSAQVANINAQTQSTNIENLYKADTLKANISQASSSASFNFRRSSGYSYNYKLGPVSYSYSGDKQNPRKVLKQMKSAIKQAKKK